MRALTLGMLLLVVACGTSSLEPAARQASSSSAAACQVDADCSLLADYCQTCSCLAAPAATAAPTCETPACATFVALCQGRSAVCASGACAVK